MKSHKYWIGTLTLGALLALSIIIPRAIPSHNAEAVGGTPFDLTADCDADAGVQDGSVAGDCVYPTGTTSITVPIVLTNNSGAAADLGSFQFAVLANQLVLNPPVGADADLNANPNFNEGLVPSSGTWNCSLAVPSNDRNADPAVAESWLGCFLPGTAVPFPAGASLTLATVTYNIAGNGTSTLAFRDTVAGDAGGVELLNCAEPGTQLAPFCDVSNVTIGAAGQPTQTPIPPTNTPTPVFSPTPCPNNVCPTATAQATINPHFKTVTPTATPATPTAVPTTAPGGETPGGTTPGGTTPGGGTGPGGTRPIRLPDTGAGNGGAIDWSVASLLALIALGAGGATGGAWYITARSRARQS